jgi:hypothetical protein
MGGYITRRVVLRHTWTVVRLFGVRAWWACLTAPKGATFLSIVNPYGGRQ